MSAQPRKGDELDEILSNHENLCEDQTNACGDCRRLKQAIEALIRNRELIAQQTELTSLDTKRHYGKDYQESLDELDEYKNNRLATIQAELDKGDPGHQFDMEL